MKKDAVETEQPKLGAWKEAVRYKVVAFIGERNLPRRRTYTHENFKAAARLLGAKIDEESGNFSKWINGEAKKMGAENLEILRN